MKIPLFASALTVVSALAAFAPLAAVAQNQNQNQNQNRPQNQNPLAPFGIRPGAVPTGAGAIPLLGTGQNVIRGNQVVPINTGGNAVPTTTFTPNPYYGYGGGGGTTVIINNNNGYQINNGYGYANGYSNGYGYTNGYNNYPNGAYNNGVTTVTTSNGGGVVTYGNGYNNGYYNPVNPRYVSGILPNPNYVVPGVPVTQTVRTGNAATVTLFNGYAPIWSSGQTVLSPFGSFYGSPAYIGSQYVVATPYPYLSGRETTVLNGITILGGDGAVYSSNAPQTGTQAPSDANAEAEAAASNAVAGRKAALLRDALADVQAFWVKEDVRALRRRLQTTGTVGVFQNEKFAYSLRRTDFLAMSSDTLDRIQTQSLKWKRVVERNDGLVNAYAAHTYHVRGVHSATDTGLRSATVRVTFVWDGDWYVSAISFAPGSLAGR